jgi:glycosyltransferase involved in cell wall biosynthesis
MGGASDDTGSRYCFFAERQVGIGSAAGAIQPYLSSRPDVTWTDVTYVKDGGLLERLPLPKRVSGTLRGYQQTGASLRRGPFAALGFLTHNPAVFRQRDLERTPTLLWTDVTPALLDSQAAMYDHPVDSLRSISRAKHTLVQRTFEKAKLCVGWSDWARRSFVADYGIAEEHTAVLPPGVDLSYWRVPERAPSASTPRLLFVGGDFKRKGGDLLLALYRDHFAGRCELDLVTRDPVAPMPGVRVHHGLSPRSPQLLELYQNAHAFVLPTRGDCFSIASLEAMAMGLPVVVSKVGGIPEIVAEGQSGYLVDPNDARGFRSALETLLQTDTARRQGLGSFGRKLVEQRFNAELTAARLVELLARISRSA